MRTCGLRRSEFPPLIISFCLVAVSIPLAVAQTAPTATTSPVAATSGTFNAATSQLQTFLANRQALASEFQSLMAQGASPTQLQAWRQANSSRIAALQKLAQAVSAGQPAQPLAYITDVNIPVDASPALEAFLTAQANLFNLRAQLHNQQLQSSGTVDESKVDAAFRQQNAAALQVQTHRAQTLTTESEQQPQPLPPPLSLPPGASRQQQAFLTLRDQLMREEIQLNNQNLSLTPAARHQLLQQWRQQNAGRIHQLQQAARNLSTTTSSTQN